METKRIGPTALVELVNAPVVAGGTPAAQELAVVAMLVETMEVHTAARRPAAALTDVLSYAPVVPLLQKQSRYFVPAVSEKAVRPVAVLAPVDEQVSAPVVIRVLPSAL